MNKTANGFFLNPPLYRNTITLQKLFVKAVRSSKIKYLFLLVAAFVGFSGCNALFAQKKTKIQLERADNLIGNKTAGTDLNIFVGNVIFKHEGTFLYCDSAVFNNKANNLDAFGKVHALVNDTLSLYGDVLNYDGNTRIAIVTGVVKLVDNRSTLTTDRLVYDRNTQIAFYTTGGTIVNKDNTLVSRRGYYHTSINELFFKDSVVLVNPEYVVNSDTLQYNTATEIVKISGPTTIKGDDEFLYAEDGWYDTKSDKSELIKNPSLTYKEQFLSGDKIYYDKETGVGKAFGNVFMKDTVQNIILKSEFADYRRKDGYAYSTDSALAILIDKTDSLFMHADTLRMIFDSLENPTHLKSYYHTKFFKTDLQGKCDSLVYSFNDSTITMIGRPALWTQANQLTANQITIYSSGQKIDSLFLDNASFIISVDKHDLSKYNQIKGKTMTGYFKENELYQIDVEGNSETIYFVREEDGGLIGINKAVSSSMKIMITDRQIGEIYYFEQPDATLYPEKEYPVEELKLKDFKWLGKERPKSKYEIFRW